jgi:hypothetical protein
MKAYAQVRGSRDVSGGVNASPQPQNREVNKNTADTGPLFIIFVIVAVIYGIVSAMLVYHWSRFGKNDKVIQFAQLVYFVITLLLLVVALFAIL